MRTLALLLLALAISAVTMASAPAAQATTASFTYFPSDPLTGENVSFDASSSTADPGAAIDSWSWNFGDGAVESGFSSVSHSFARPGVYNVRLVVTDSHSGSAETSLNVTVRNRAPTASFTYAPASPGTGERVSFTSTSSDPEGAIASQLWDLDNDGSFDDASGPTAARVFPNPGNYSVSLKVTDAHGGASVAVGTVPVGNRPPLASFIFSPDPPAAGDTVTFFSTAGDPDGPITAQAWDLDGDGNYNDATGSVATRAFASPGSYVVGLQVVDGSGVTAFASRNFSVLPRAVAAAQGARLLSPFPVVRMVGTVTRKGVRLRRFLVDAPSGAKVTVRCRARRSRRCPFRKQSRIASLRSSSRRAHVARLLRFRRLERRLLRAGVRINVMVTKPGTIGKYTFFRIRRARPPLRIDRCLVPGVPRPTRCPSS